MAPLIGTTEPTKATAGGGPLELESNRAATPPKMAQHAAITRHTPTRTQAAYKITFKSSTCLDRKRRKKVDAASRASRSSSLPTSARHRANCDKLEAFPGSPV